MKKSIFLASALLLAMSAACNKNDVSSEPTRQEGVPMTLTATIGEPATKVSTTDDAANRKLTFEWEAGDKVSVISLDASHNLISNDIFTADAAGSTTTFTGTYKGGASANQVMVYYPALTESYEDSGKTKWRVPVESGGYSDEGIMYDLYDEYISVRGWAYSLQTALDSPSHLKNYLIMVGEADKTDLASNKLTVTLNHNTTIFKVNLTLPSSGKTLKDVRLELKNADDSNSDFVSHGWGESWRARGFSLAGGNNYATICLGSSVSGGSGTGLVAAGTTATVYIPCTLSGMRDAIADGNPEVLTITSGQKFLVYVFTSDGFLTQTLTFAADKELTPGRLYTINCAPTE